MDLDDFWALLRTRRTDDDFAALTDELATRDADEIIAFEDRLTEVLYAIDTPAHAKAARARNDWFLYVRCAAVGAGRETYEQILEEPGKLRRFARKEAEHLLTVSPAAYERSTGRLWEHETALSYESGSNTAAWGEPPPHPDLPGLPAEHEPGGWLTVHTTIYPPGGYEHHLDRIGYAVGRDPAWQTWWSAAGIPRCDLTFADPSLGVDTTVKVGRERVEAQAGATGGDLPEALADTTALLAAVRTRLELAPLPPLPEPADDLPPGYGPDEPPELGPMSLVKAVLFVLRGRRAARRAGR